MWLLSTDSVRLQDFCGPDEVPGGYVILSHVWQAHEETFQQIQSLQRSGTEMAHASGTWPKIHGSMNVAKLLGYAWLWIDTVCIDKTNSTELEEAINSMFRWYAESSACLAYLADVPDDCHVEAPQSAFRKSKWFTRGWTLQELIAPRQLLFMSEGWKCLGTKASLADLVEEITGIDAEVLTFRRVLDHVSVARRMSWASGRVTSKVEDEAYSLMGLFDVSMSTIYGEGKNAFRRLQEKIMKRSSDHTLFAWGNVMSEAAVTWTSQTHRHKKDTVSSLLAPSPTAFNRTHPVRLTSVHLDVMVKLVRSCIEVSNAKPRSLPEHAVTSHGIRCHLVVVHGDPFSIALLPCRDSSRECLGLLLWRRPIPAGNIPLYIAGASFQIADDGSGRPVGTSQQREVLGYRLLNIRPSTVVAVLNYGRQRNSSNLHTVVVKGHGVEMEPKAHGALEEIYITDAAAPASLFPHPWKIQLHNAVPHHIFIPTWVETYVRQFGFTISNDTTRAPTVFGQVMKPPLMLTLVHLRLAETIVIRLYLHGEPPSICASVAIQPAGGDTSLSSSRGHPISSWKNGSKRFGDKISRVKLTATRWPTPACYCVEIRPQGSQYAAEWDALPAYEDIAANLPSNFSPPQPHLSPAFPRLAARIPISSSGVAAEEENLPLNIRYPSERIPLPQSSMPSADFTASASIEMVPRTVSEPQEGSRTCRVVDPALRIPELRQAQHGHRHATSVVGREPGQVAAGGPRYDPEPPRGTDRRE
ncbi:hypothetical protein ACG7TL_007186 [Trametes sanguinea]